MKLKYYSDSGHGWLAVKCKALERLGLLGDISAYSYQQGETVYLEEDRDATLFLQKVRSIGIEPEISEVNHGDRSRIRSMARFMHVGVTNASLD